MKKRFSKTVSFLGALVLVVGLLSGCGGKTEDTAADKTGTESTKQEQQTGTKEETPAANKDEAAGTNDTAEPIVIKAVIKDMSPEDEVSTTFLSKVSENVSKQLGKTIKIELVPISEGTYSESMGLLLQSGQIPDLMYFQGGDYQFAITQGILEDLTSYIENSTYVKALMQGYNNERIKNYPYLLWLSPDRIKVPVVREDWFNAAASGKALLDNPTTDNYKAFFKELKDNNGLKAAYTVPGDLSEIDTVFNAAFGINEKWIKQEDGTYVYSKITEGEKQKLAFYADLYKEGLLDNEWLSKKWDTKESAFYNGEVGVVAGTEGAVINVYNTKMVNQNGENAKLVVLPPAKGAAQEYLASDVSKESRGWAISKYSENKDIVFAILEYMASPEGQVLDKLGYEGEHHTVKDGVYTLTDKISEWYARFHESTATLDVKFDPATPYFSDAANKSLEMVNQYLGYDNAFVMPEDYSTNWDAGEALFNEYAADVITGKKDVNATFDEFVESWKATVGNDVTDYANQLLNK